MISKPEMKKPHWVSVASSKSSTFGGADNGKHTVIQTQETTDPIDLIEKACIDAAGAAPARHLILSKPERFLRFSNTGKPKDKNCALKIIHKVDCIVFIIVDHRSGITKTGSTRTGKQALLTPEERAAAQRQRQEYERQKAEQSARKHRMLSAAARRVWPVCLRTDKWPDDFPYVEKKGITPWGARRYISHKKDVLVLPMVDPFKGIMSLYQIDKSGFKRPLKGSQMNGLCMAIGSDLNTAKVIWCVEGWATACSLHELTGESVVVAFTAGNLGAVMDKLVQKYPDAELKLCADDDAATAAKKHMNGKNPGLFYAKQVQKKHPQIALYKPLFPPDAPEGLSDVNDLVLYERSLQGGINHG